MNISELPRYRLYNQQISNRSFSGIKELVGWMGAMQAQDYAMSKMAVGIRLSATCDSMIDHAVENVHIIRTHILRPTWHFVSRDDIYWMLALSAPQIKAASRSRDLALGISENDFERSNELLLKILSGGKRLTRSDISAAFARIGIKTDQNRLYHFLMRGEIDGLLFSRGSGTNVQTYSLLGEYVPHQGALTREESVAALAKRYFASHGPATAHDFSWWSGLSVTESKRAAADARNDLLSEICNGQTYYYSKSLVSCPDANRVCFLPAFDEFLISYKDRTAAIPLELQSLAFTSNGIFKPIIVSDGKVVGTWKAVAKKDLMQIESSIFTGACVKSDELTMAADLLGDYYEKRIELK